MKFRELKLRKNRIALFAEKIDDHEIDRLLRILRRSRRGGTASNVQVRITPRELKSRLDRGDDLFILDVREPHEYQICNLNGHLISAWRSGAAGSRA